MRRKYPVQEGWYFARKDCGPALTLAHGEAVTLPHTWNAKDGTDGGNDYYRGRCWYVKKFNAPELNPGEQFWVELEGAAMTAEVFCNGKSVAVHRGGYSTFRAELTPQLKSGENLLAVSVDNSENDSVYPQKADFTFYGGLCRPVYFLTVPTAHFSLGYHGGSGLKVTPEVDVPSRRATVTMEAFTENAENQSVTFSVAGQTVTEKVQNNRVKAVFTLDNVHLWDGVEDPYLYTATASLDSGDNVAVRFGCRTIGFDPEKGFLLNGRTYRLCGAARHQDRQELGNALTCAEHDEDMALLREMGANTVRLAHYQHAQYFYDLCDEQGMIVWAEIPYITKHMNNGIQNTLDQMTDLIVQNYNHPSIICWGLSNEITASGGVTPEMVDNHRKLNDLCHTLDATRPTTMAHAFMLDMDDPFVNMADIRSYNLYYGWYLGELEQNDQFFDEFHKKHPNTVIGLSEYGADANPAYQNGHPEKGDWSEPYQALYHEHLLKMWADRPYIWAMHCWNMFDFAADGRDEGGKPGQNQKGLVTFDRKIKKDAFYLYKAYLSKEPFVHLCGSRYVERPEEITEVKVYSNCSPITLLVDGQVIQTLEGDKIFRFQVPLNGEHVIEACCGQLRDTITVKKVETPNPSYRAIGGEAVNWFDRPDELMREGYYSILDSMEEIKKSEAGAALLNKMMENVHKSYGEVAQSVTLPPSVQKMLDRQPLEKVLKQAGKAISPAMVKQLNNELNQIPRVQ